MKRSPGFVCGVVLAVLGVAGCTEPSITPVSPFADVVPFSRAPVSIEWQGQARSLVGLNRYNAQAAGRMYAVLAVAAYLAVVQVDQEPFAAGAVGGPFDRSRYEAERGAVAGASRQVLSTFFPGATAALDQLLADEANGGPGGVQPQFMQGVEAGTAAANAMLARAANDHFTAPWTGTIPVGPGFWYPTGPPVAPQLGDVTPWLLSSGAQVMPSPPPAYGSPAFLAALNEISVLSATRTPQQLASAIYWNYPLGTPTAPGVWNETATTYIQENQLGERAAAHVYALLHASIFDAQIGCFKAKYTYFLIRPSQADPTITLPIGLPNHASYPSGHACISAAGAGVLSHFFPEHTADLQYILSEGGLSRMYAGIHYRFDVDVGNQLGGSVAAYAIGIDQANGMLSVIH